MTTMITLSREHWIDHLMPQTKQVIAQQTLTSGSVVTVHGSITETERDLGLLFGTYTVKVSDPDDPNFHVGTWLIRFEPADWARAGVLGVADEFGDYPPGHHERCQREYDRMAAELGI